MKEESKEYWLLFIREDEGIGFCGLYWHEEDLIGRMKYYQEAYPGKELLTVHASVG
jgi:hypothetical protein